MTLLHKIHSNIIHVRPKREQSKCLSIGKWIKKNPYKYYSVIQRIFFFVLVPIHHVAYGSFQVELELQLPAYTTATAMHGH